MQRADDHRRCLTRKAARELRRGCGVGQRLVAPIERQVVKPQSSRNTTTSREKTMLRGILRVGALGAALGLQTLLAPSAFANSVSITAEAVCAEGGAVINYTSTSWSLEAAATNTAVDIAFNGNYVATGAYVFATGNTFSGSAPAPTGSSAVVSATAVGTWGSGAAGGQSTSITVDLPTDCPSELTNGRFTGGGHQIRIGDARVTRGFTIHCDLLLSNNLEVNWGGNKFHMTEHLTTVECSDDPAIIQAPPPAPLDTLVGVGTGRYNGVDGYTIEFTLQDYGEPGSSDRAALLIYETANPANVALSVPLQLLTGGNLQAHYDQPHR
jgi:hypothetical protein